jgi:hypothetical protein
MKLLLLKHKTIKPYFNELNDELVLFGNWLTKLGVPYDFTFKDFDEDLEYQPYNGNAFYALSTSFMKRMAGKYETAGEFHSIFFLHAPTHEKSAGIFTTHGYDEFNGSAVADIPVSEEDAKRTDHYLWRVFSHEWIHSCFAILNQAYKLNIPDYQDQAYQEYRKIHPTVTEEELTQLSENIFRNSIEPYKDKLSADLPAKKQYGLLSGLISVYQGVIAVMEGVVKLLSKKENKREKVIDLLASIIAYQEGFYKKGYITRAQKNHNQGNLIFVGQSKAIGKDDKGFAIFANDQDGWEALKFQLNYIFDGKSKYYLPDFSINDFVAVWASTSPHNEKVAYANAIARVFGVSPETPLNELENYV